MSRQVDLIRPTRRVPAWQIRLWEVVAPRVPEAVLRLAASPFMRLPLGSRVRRWYVVTMCQIGWDVTGRNRFKAVRALWDPAAEWHWDAYFQSVGFDEAYHGHDGVVRSVQRWNEIWTEVRFTVREIVDGGDTWVIRVTASGRGASSGVPVEQPFSSVCRLNPFIRAWGNHADDAEALAEADFA